MNRLGIAVSGGPNPSEIVELVTLAESLGYDSAWIAEGHGGDQFAVLSGCAMQTSRIKLGTAISSVYVRSIPTIAPTRALTTTNNENWGRFSRIPRRVIVRPSVTSAFRCLRRAGHGLATRQPPGRRREHGSRILVEARPLLAP